ncbi:uncharacterized protein GVI51_G06127 [Nakaseomyces glabratus]|uniref:Single-strand annealing weakened protein 1 n=2 Tax=Candida glabrata TaxID=5478 RepID=Q6FT09_CANGA|nr:uncharacterized protein CAGL0G06292g [Nakaseomyces glabratus]KAH7603388.1 Single strand annealing-weakened 1 [Nakaseomyces glabratus]KAH7606911.1 Single strand annealing-weakened 1 [Nakaseomyces glabratus]KTA96215.1 Single-strand annealing weakened protein 1 [Nakaseomyces glabratus]KTB07098.1 Single-strand annealing weakened protein 1 [Nakaseomyces glabratus]KTB07466.1 Single-strand annealing weakened protein 1 [Nakaseomyces glabratus]|eukprot:XP_446635.1 uncharacterized protein CAGL0G06292g [[Candida] glabrata]
MVQNIAYIKVAKDSILPVRVHINRRQILSTATEESKVQAPLLSNNTIVCLKSPLTKIYLSNTDLKNLVTEMEDDIILILYELSSPAMKQNIFSKIRVGQVYDFDEDTLKKFPQSIQGSLKESNLTSLKRVGKMKYKLTYRKNWDVDIFISNINKLETIRTYLIFKDQYPQWNEYPCLQKQQSLLVMGQKLSESTNQDPIILQEEEELNLNYEQSAEDQPNNEKPEIAFTYEPQLSLIQCLDLYILKRPKRKRS